jgi:hypothetical protein
MKRESPNPLNSRGRAQDGNIIHFVTAVRCVIVPGIDSSHNGHFSDFVHTAGGRVGS